MSDVNTPEFGALNTLGQSFQVMFGEFKFFAVVAFLYIFVSVVPYLFILDGVDITDPAVILGMAEQGNTLFGVLTLLYYLLYSFMIIVILDKTNATVNGLPFEDYPYVNRGLKAVLPIVLIYISTIIMVGFGLVLLIIPGLIVMAGLYLASAIKLAENISFDQALLKSWSMTKGRKLSIWGIILIPLVPMLIITFGLMGILFTQMMGEGGIETVFSPWVLIINSLVSALFTIFYVITSGVAYHQIKSETEIAEG